MVNCQVRYGTDILTRITYSLEDPSHAQDLQKATVETFRQLLEALTDATGINAAKCPLMIVSGNTTMIHFLLGLHAYSFCFSLCTGQLRSGLSLGRRGWNGI